jgi:hypothetical protein
MSVACSLPSRHPAARLALRLSLAFAAVLLTIGPAMAQAEDEANVPGEVVLNTPFEFVRFQVDGKPSWENHEYTKKNKTLIILGLDRDEAHTVVLTPRDGKHEPATIELKPEAFKRTVVRKGGKRIAVFRATRGVKFAKLGAAPAPKTAGAAGKGEAGAAGKGEAGAAGKGEAGAAGKGEADKAGKGEAGAAGKGEAGAAGKGEADKARNGEADKARKGKASKR